MFKDISIKIGLVIQRESGLKSIYWGYTMGWNNFRRSNRIFMELVFYEISMNHLYYYAVMAYQIQTQSLKKV